MLILAISFFFFFQAEDGIRDYKVTGVQTCALPICAAFLLAALGCSGSTGPTGAPIAKIAFYTNRDGNDEVYLMNADGTGLVNLTKDRESGVEGKSVDLGGRRII